MGLPLNALMSASVNCGGLYSIALIEQMIREIPVSQLKDPESKFIDNCAGSGNFLVCLCETLQEYHSRDHIINNMLYAVELMEEITKDV